MGAGVEVVDIENVEQTHERWHIALQRRGPEMLVNGVEASEEFLKAGRADRDGEHGADRRVHGVTAAHPIPETKRIGGVDAEGGHLVQRGRHGHEVFGHGVLSGGLRAVDGALVGHEC
jgi:hypothetical protein